ncbi:MAG: single-stranded-DNA-specific exonuclease RecJ [Chitinispirillales bacterium]|jgi:single-stranded-DNA-specific exonuclease|nr:single-stranded-DNA-specific exonuclease RecJ [Chitinispirillales bacterium]
MSKYERPREKIILREYDEKILEKIKSELNISEMFTKILMSRGLTDFEKSKLFFNPSLENLHDPFLFKQMGVAVERILKVKKSGKIVIYGDYDVDGITAVSLLLRVLNKISITADCYLPDRLSEGYGVSKNGIDSIIKSGADLIITVDCGITAVEEVEYAKQNGIDMIITDHHEPKDEIPKAAAVIDPKIAGENYPDKNLAGVGVALKLAHALCQKSGAKEFWKDELDLAAFGTAADIVPLDGENRIITAFGYKKMQQNHNLGLSALIVAQNMKGRSLATNDIIFKLSPLVNAAGRMGDPKIGVKLFLSNDAGECENFVKILVSTNTQRREIEETISKEAFLLAEETIDFENEFAVVVAKKGWHSGIVGIVAARLVERFCRPSVLFSVGEDNIASGSIRTFGNCDVLKALNDCGDVLLSFGGHKSAAGLSVKMENLEIFRKKFNAAVKKQINFSDLSPTIIVDSEIDVVQLTPKFFENLKRIEPFGPANMRPVFVAKNLNHKFTPKAIGKNSEHLKMYLNGGGYSIDAVGFGFGNRIEEIKTAKNFTICFVLGENTYMGKSELQMEIRAIEI